MERDSLNDLIDGRDPGGNVAPVLARIDGKGERQFSFNLSAQALRTLALRSWALRLQNLSIWDWGLEQSDTHEIRLLFAYRKATVDLRQGPVNP
jgi:hypothetical protein